MKLIRFVTLFLCLAFATCVAHAQTIPNLSLPGKTFFQPNGKKVFAWYITGCPAFCSWTDPFATLVANDVEEIKEAKSMGIDGFGLDVMQANPNMQATVAALFQAAQQVGGFQLFFEFDEGTGPLPSPDYVWYMQQYANHPAYFRVNGQAVMGCYGGEYGFSPASAGPAWWQTNVIAPLATAGINVYFVPTTWQQFGNATAEVAGWGSVASGQQLWQIQNSPIGGGLTTLDNYAAALHSAGKTWMSTVSFHYWWASANSLPGWGGQNGHYFEHAGGSGLNSQWLDIINVQNPEWVMMLTWNDYNESYIAPVDDYRKYRNNTAYVAPLGWYQPQTGLGELNRYYIQWYKSGIQPTITSDALFYNYRIHSASLIASGDARSPVTCGNGTFADSIYVTTALTSPATLRVVSGGTTTNIAMAAGIQSTTVPMNAGTQTFSIIRGATTVATVTGAPIASSITMYDYWPTTGYVESP
ncbi:MAG TPA: endo-1,3-alpha-glucanase family glycosylhydrolase [Capsulimonadaceae bacterium]|jgi:hypothetical protein